MRLFDEKARRNIRPYFIQCSLATLTILLILVFLDVIKHTAIIATLGPTVFLIFALPSTYSSRPRPLLGGYLIAIIIGSLFYFLTTLSVLEHLPVSIKTIYIVFGAMAVGCTIFMALQENMWDIAKQKKPLTQSREDAKYSLIQTLGRQSLM